MPFDGRDDKTNPGAQHKLLEGPADAAILATLGASIEFYAGRLEQLAGEVRRGALTNAQRKVLSRDLREVSRETGAAAAKIDEGTRPEPEEPAEDGSITVEIDD